MSNQNYVNVYIDIMTNTLQEAILRNISLQANAKITDEVLKDLQSNNDRLKKEFEELGNRKASETNSLVEELQSNNLKLEDTVTNLNEEIRQLKLIRDEYEKIKGQVQHVETFRNELNKCRENEQNIHQSYREQLNKCSKNEQKIHDSYHDQIKELNDHIEYLKLTPAKRKKVDEAKKMAEQPNVTEKKEDVEEKDGITEDGGSF